MNRPAEQMTKGAAYRRSFLYKPGDMNAHTWYKIHGDAMKMKHSSGSFIQITWKFSIGERTTNDGSFIPISRKALIAGSCTTTQSRSQKVRHRTTETPRP